MATDYIVQPGDCISSLAGARGLKWDTVWNHPKNAQLKAKRKDPNVLMPGDVIYLPDLDPRIEDRHTDQRHEFVLLGERTTLRIRLLYPEDTDDTTAAARPSPPEHGARHIVDGDPETTVQKREVPRSNAPYTLSIDGVSISGRTDGQGYIETRIPSTAQAGSLIIDAGTLRQTVIPIQLGYLDPLEEVSGVKQRLANLGFDGGDTSSEVNEAFGAALRAFQEVNGLDITGEADETTLRKLKSIHGS
jgi:hypothetical protein